MSKTFLVTLTSLSPGVSSALLAKGSERDTARFILCQALSNLGYDVEDSFETSELSEKDNVLLQTIIPLLEEQTLGVPTDSTLRISTHAIGFTVSLLY